MSPIKTEEPEWPEATGLQEALGYTFQDVELLETALKHASFAHERDSSESNERLEFLGDSVLGVVIAHALYDAHPDWPEGELTLSLQHLVDKRSLAKLGLELGIGSYVRLGRTEVQSGGESKAGIISDAVEAILGAMYLDGGLEPVEGFLKRVFAKALDKNAPRLERDPKTRFQEWVMARTGSFPTYECVANNGIDGDENRFTVEVRVEGESWGAGTGRNKKLAERMAASRALEKVDQIEDEPDASEPAG